MGSNDQHTPTFQKEDLFDIQLDTVGQLGDISAVGHFMDRDTIYR